MRAAALTILVSVVVRGVAVTSVLRFLDRRGDRKHFNLTAPAAAAEP